MVITFTGNRTIKFVYDAGGAKLEKITNDGESPTVTYDYVNEKKVFIYFVFFVFLSTGGLLLGQTKSWVCPSSPYNCKFGQA